MLDVLCYDCADLMAEALETWVWIVNHKDFKKVDFAAMFTKEDVLTERKLEALPFGNYCSDFEGDPKIREDVVQCFGDQLKARIEDMPDFERSIMVCHAGSIAESTTGITIKRAILHRESLCNINRRTNPLRPSIAKGSATSR